jgi:hypothetical protein
MKLPFLSEFQILSFFVKAKTKGSMKNLKNTQTRNLMISKIMKKKKPKIINKIKELHHISHN